MLRHILVRLLSGLGVVLGVTVTVFVVARITGDPVKQLLPFGSSIEAQESLRAQLHLDDPLLSQFGQFMSGMIRFDFGDSLWQRVPARQLVFDRLPNTLLLVGAAVSLAIVIFVPLGVIASLRAGSRIDRWVVSGSLIGVSLPEFWVGAVLILIFAVQLGWLPTSGMGSIEHLVLPAFTLALGVGSRLAQVTRSTMLSQLGAPYVAALRTRGFGETQIVLRHVIRNALVPIVTVLCWEFGMAIGGGAIVVESVFSWPGIGQLLLQATLHQDIILMQAIVFVCALLIVALNLMGDIIYTVVDPRVDIH